MTEPATDLCELLADLSARGLLHQCTNLPELNKHLALPRRVYAGFDPTKDSLTIGNMVSILLLRRFQLAGHTPVVVMGGGTGLIGDPSGKDAERQLLTREKILENVAGQRKIFEQLLSFSGPNAALILNNAEWIETLSFVDVLRDVGKHFSINMMIQRDSVKTRLLEREHGISYTEFSYMILQAYDFSYLSQKHGVTLQMGGSDQWGNIVAGVDLTRRQRQVEVYGLTTPLITKKDGGKFGKTESGAVWLTKDRTSCYAFYQFWLNVADEDLPTFFQVFSFKPKSEIAALLAAHAENPGERLAQRALADELTESLHGSAGKSEAQQATAALFSGQVEQLPKSVIDEAFAG
ncbi:MAG TPA: tyrosine--tRNA ligase, partial [Polyangiaceae bacterium]|nr:tyrosine--tRNA ligase [Polyangiaceae bacterium]